MKLQRKFREHGDSTKQAADEVKPYISNVLHQHTAKKSGIKALLLAKLYSSSSVTRCNFHRLVVMFCFAKLARFRPLRFETKDYRRTGLLFIFVPVGTDGLVLPHMQQTRSD